jgi:hypothetical protein
MRQRCTSSEGEHKADKLLILMTAHRCMARGGHGLPKVSPWSAMPYPSTPYRQATPETAVGVPPEGVNSCILRPSSTTLDTPRRTPILVSAATNQTRPMVSFGTFFYLAHLVGTSTIVRKAEESNKILFCH